MEPTRTLCDPQPAAADRMEYLDVAKGILIILVIIAHHLLGAGSFKRYLYYMGVTPFLLITGFLCAYRKEWERPFGKTAVGKLRKLIYPFFTFSIINLLWNILFYKLVFTSQVPDCSIPQMLIYTVSTYGYNALWYLPCAFWGTLLFFALRRLKHHGLVWVISAIGLLVFYILLDRKLTGLGIVSYIYSYVFRSVVAMVFLYAGSLIFLVFRSMGRALEILLLLICTTFSAVVIVMHQVYPEFFPHANLAAHSIGNPYVYYLATVSHTMAILLLCRKFLKKSRVLSYFGRNSLVLMALHMDVTGRIAWCLFPQMRMDFGETVNSIIVIIMELLMFPVIITVINRWFPFVLTLKKVKN